MLEMLMLAMGAELSRILRRATAAATVCDDEAQGAYENGPTWFRTTV